MPVRSQFRSDLPVARIGFDLTGPSSTRAPTVLVLSLDPATPPPAGDPIKLHVTVTPSGATGSVRFYNKTTLLGSANLSGGECEITAHEVPAATTFFSAHYEGDSSYGPSGDYHSESYILLPDDVTIDIESSLNPSVAGDSVTITATVAPADHGNEETPTGTVQFTLGGVAWGTPVALVNGVATKTSSELTAGSYSVHADYSGDDNFEPGLADASWNQVVKVVTTTGLACDLSSPRAYGTTLTFTATVSSGTGNVVFKDGVTTIGTVALTNGTAQLQVGSLGVGDHSITANYAGDDSHASSVSSAVPFTVSLISTTTSLDVSPASPQNSGTQLTLTATVSSGTGTVQFKDGAAALGSPVAVSNGQAQYQTSALAVGAHTLSAVYSGDTTHDTSQSSGSSYTINSAAQISIVDKTVWDTDANGYTGDVAVSAGSTLVVAWLVAAAAQDMTACTFNGNAPTGYAQNAYEFDQTGSDLILNVAYWANVAAGTHSLAIVYGDEDATVGMVNEVTGAAASPLDKTAHNSYLSQASPTCTTAATAQARELALAYFARSGEYTDSGQWGNSFTARQIAPGENLDALLGMAYKILTSTGAVTANKTVCATGVAEAICVQTFKEAT